MSAQLTATIAAIAAWTVTVAIVIAVAPRDAAADPATTPADDPVGFERDLDALFVGGGITADQAAARAVTSSPEVARRLAELDEATVGIEVAQLARVPQVAAHLSYTRLNALSPVVLGEGFPPIPYLNNATVAEGSIAIPLSDYLLRHPQQIAAAKLARDAAALSQNASARDASLDARLAYYEWLRAKLQVVVANRQLRQVQSTLAQIHALAELQRVSGADVLRVESQQAEAEQTVDQLATLAGLREEQLRVQIGLRGGEPLAIGEDIRVDVTVPAPAADSLDALATHAAHERADLRAADTAIAAKEQERIADHANRYPKLSAFGVLDYEDPNPRVFPQSDSFVVAWQVGAAITWTLGDTLTAHTTEERLGAQANALRADRDNLGRGNRIEVLSAQRAIAVAQHALRTTAVGLAAADESYRVRRELLTAGRATAVELVDAETDLTRARIAALDARVDLRVAIAQLAHAVGDDR